MADNQFLSPGGYYGAGVPDLGQSGDSAVDLMRLIDSLEALVSAAVRIPWVNKVLLDRDDLLDLIDQLRVTVPEDVQEARSVLQEREDMLNEAEAEAERIRRRAQEEALARLSETDQVKAAQQLAHDLLEEARREAAAIRHDADAYALEVLSRLESEVASQLNTIRGGVRTLQAAVRNGVHPPSDRRE